MVSINNLADCPLTFAEISTCKFEGKNGKINAEFPFGAFSMSTHSNIFLQFLTITVQLFYHCFFRLHCLRVSLLITLYPGSCDGSREHSVSL